MNGRRTTDPAAPAVFLYRRRSTLEMVALDPAHEIGAGGEAVVYHVPGDAGLVAKIYRDPAIERARKLALMLANPPAMPEGTSIAWPLDVLLHGRGFAGFVMPFAEGPRVFEFYNPVTRRTHAPGFHFGLLHRAGRNLAAAFDALHAAGYVVGDVNESNLLVAPSDARVTLVDADSLQVRDPDGGVFRSKMGKAEFTPPELQGVSFGTIDRAPEHDRFGLAVLLFLLLMEGTHPFAVRLGEADAAPVEERIRRGLFPHASEEDEVHPPRLSPRWDALDGGMREMFVRAFVAGHADPAARPTAAEWRDALEAAEARLLECGANPLHRFAPHLGACPWCERARLLAGRDPFPAGAPAPARVPRPRRPRRVSAPVAPVAPAAPISTPAAPPVSPYGVRQPMKWMVNATGSGGPGPVFNPLTFIPAAAVFAFAGSALAQVTGAMALVTCVVLLVVRGLGRTTLATIAAAATLFMASMLVVTASRADAEPDAVDAAPRAVLPPPAPGAAPAPAAHAATVEVPPDLEGYLLPDIVSLPVSQAQGMPLPQSHFNGPALPIEGRAYPLPEARAVPWLAFGAETEQLLAVLPHVLPQAAGAGSERADTVVLLLRIGRDGRVRDGGWQVLASTHPVAREAAKAAVPYLHYFPSWPEDQDHPHAAWVVQRLVFVP